MDQFDLLANRMQKQPFYARNQRQLLLQAGFAHAEGGATANSWGTLDRTLDVARYFELILSDMVSKRGLEEGWADQATLDRMRREIRAWGNRPDAFMIVPICHAIGWVATPRSNETSEPESRG
jgi:hypothetical protein